MASRMERYYKTEQTEERSKKNEHLYKQISELGSYTNIEGVTDISNSNEININMVKQMLQKREDYHRNRNYDEIIGESSEESAPAPKEVEEKNYDLREILDKAKVDHSDRDLKYRSIKTSQYDILKNIKIDENTTPEDLRTIFNTLSLNNQNNAETPADDLGMFDDLKSNTMVGDPSSIKKILEETKKSEEDAPTVEQVVTGNLDNIDKTFYTSSFSFSDKDFEDLRSLDTSLKKNNKLIKVLIVVFSVLIAIAILIVVMRFVF